MLDIELINKKLWGNIFTKKIYYFEEVDSTNLFAKTIADDDALIIAEYQSTGKGRHERTWESDKGANLTFTIKKKLDIKNEDIPFINFFFSSYIYDALKKYLAENNINTSPLNIKWPNDILYDNKKICGVLIESVLNRKEFIIGIGINMNQAEFSQNHNAVSLSSIAGHKIDITAFLIDMMILFDKNFSRLNEVDGKLYEKWKNSTDIIGKSVVFNSHDLQNKFGNVIDLQRDGGIKLLINGSEEVYFSGEIKITLIGN